MREAAETMGQLLCEGGNTIIFCSPLQLHEWHGALKTAPGRGTFNVDPHPLSMINRPGHYFGNVRRLTNYLFPVISWAVHATKTGLTNEGAAKLVNYTNFDYVPSRHPA